MISIRSVLEIFFGALRFFTRLPVPRWVGHGHVGLERAVRYFPMSGLIVGGIAALVFGLSALFWPKTLAILAAMATAIYLTGAIHEDGWGDMADGFGAGGNKEQVLSLMKDSRMGNLGAVALIALLLCRFFALLELAPHQIPLALIAGHALSRLCATLVLAALDYVRVEGKARPFDNRLRRSELAFAAVTGLLPLLLLPPQQSLPALVLALGTTLWLARLFQRRIGGYTGDCLGATQQLAELAFYGGLLCRLA